MLFKAAQLFVALFSLVVKALKGEDFLITMRAKVPFFEHHPCPLFF